MDKKFCPRCGNEVEAEFSKTTVFGIGGTIYVCKKCGYRGPLFLKAKKRKT